VEQVQRHHQAVLFHSAGASHAMVQDWVQTALSVARHSALKDVVLARDWPAVEAAMRVHIAESIEIYHEIIKAGLTKGQIK
jgi:DNA-binding FadR family transcriptional regulator